MRFRVLPAAMIVLSAAGPVSTTVDAKAKDALQGNQEHSRGDAGQDLAGKLRAQWGRVEDL